MKVAHYISLFLLGSLLNVFFISCKNNPDTENSVPENSNNEKQESCMTDDYWNYKEWLRYYAAVIPISEENIKILTDSFEIFEMRIISYISENVKFSLNFINDEFTNDLSIGELSIKSLEQIINTQIDFLNDLNSCRILKRISLHYPESTFTFSRESLLRINDSYTEIDKSDLKKKEKKRLFQQKVTEEILNTYIEECSRQNIFIHFK